MKDRRQKTIALVAMIVAVVGLSVGFAAFSNNLLIKSRVSVNPDSSDFGVVFSTSSSSVVTNAVTPTKSPTSITATDGTIDNSVTPTLENLSATFTSPGQKVVYNLYVYNAGKYIAYLNSVTLKGNKSCTPGEGTSVELAGQACESISVTVKIGNDSYNKTTTGIQGKSIGIGDSTPVEITIEYLNGGARSDGPFSVEFSDISLYYATVSGQNEVYEGESQILYTGEIYRNSGFNSYIGHPISGWCMDVPGVANSCVANDYDMEIIYNSEEECELAIQEASSDPTYAELAAMATCVQGSLEYETDVTNISQNYYLKHEVVNNVITASYACITYTENGVRKDVCLRGGDASYYASNQAILRSVEPYFNTLDDSSHSTGKGYCTFNDLHSYCYSDTFDLHASSDGDVFAGDGSLSCNVNSDGNSYC